MENLEIYEKVRSVPKEAQRTITGGKLNGKTDINPMWRIKKLTETFGACGIGWVAPIVDRWIDEGANGEKVVNIKIALQVKVDGEWSKPIEGIGGNTLTQTEKGKLVTNDEAYKMAYTDAISVACKMLGVGADIYWDKDKTKYDKEDDNEPPKPVEKPAKVGDMENPFNDLPFKDIAPTQPVKSAHAITMQRELMLKEALNCDEKLYKELIASVERVWGRFTLNELSDEEFSQVLKKAKKMV